MTDLKSYGENVAAIAARLHEDKETYQGIYDNLADQLSGFVGIWRLCADAAAVFSEEEALYTAGEDFDWIAAIDGYAGKLMGCLQIGEIPAISDMRRLAGRAIMGNSI